MTTNEEQTINTTEEVSSENTVSKTTSTTKKSSASKATEEAKSNREAELEKQLAAMLDMVKSLQDQINSQKNQTSQPNIIVSAPSTDVTLVYMSDSLGVVQANNVTLNCTRFGEKFTLSRSDFDAIVGKYRSWFDQGILAVDSKDINVAAAKGLRTDKEFKVNEDILRKIGTMPLNELEEFWNSINENSHKLSITTYYKRKFIEDEENGYRDRARIDLMNRLTNGGFEREALEVSGANMKIRPTELT